MVPTFFNLNVNASLSGEAFLDRLQLQLLFFEQAIGTWSTFKFVIGERFSINLEHATFIVGEYRCSAVSRMCHTRHVSNLSVQDTYFR